MEGQTDGRTDPNSSNSSGHDRGSKKTPPSFRFFGIPAIRVSYFSSKWKLCQTCGIKERFSAAVSSFESFKEYLLRNVSFPANWKPIGFHEATISSQRWALYKRLDSPCHTTRGFLKFSGDIEGNRRHEIGYPGPFGRPSFTLSDWNYFISIDILLKLVLEEPTQQSILVYNQQWKH